MIDKGSRIDVALSILREGDRLLDVGCGDGMFGYCAKEKYKSVYGVDNNDKFVDESTKKGIIAQKIDLDKSFLPYENKFFDTVVMLDVIEHIRDPAGIVSEISRVIKPDGIFIISVPNMRYWKHIYDVVVCGRFPLTSTDDYMYDGGHIHYFTFKNIKGIIEKYGFEVKRKIGVFGRDYCVEFLSSGLVIEAVKS